MSHLQLTRQTGEDRGGVVGDFLAEVEVMVVMEMVEMVVMVEEDRGESGLRVELFVVLGRG